MMFLKAEPYIHSDSMLIDIVDEVGSGFTFGLTTGFTYYFFKGSKGRTFANSLRAAALHAPRIGGVGVGCTLSWFAVNSGLAFLRHRNDPINSFCAGAATAAVATASRGGAFASLAGVCFGGFIAGVDVRAADTRKLEAGLDWRPTGPPGCVADEFALLELTRLARSNAAKKEDKF